MYFPIIRGRQYDLLALRELKREDRLNKKIIPIIEPVKLNSTLSSTIREFEENQSKLIVISNPKVGSLLGELSLPSSYQQYKEIMLNDYVIIGHYFNKNSQNQVDKINKEFNVSLGDIAIIHFERSLISLYKEIYGERQPWINVIPLDNSFRRQLSGQSLVGLGDKFNKLSRNADYLEQDTEFFSEDHLFYREEGYIGFSDYSVIGQEYSESGFAPYAVAIHIVYPNSENALEIVHFVSDSNSDTSDPAGKFFEALEKFVLWYKKYSDDERMNTLAIQILIKHYEDGTYPGLPTLKKLSIMHHLELIGSLID
ncbi:sce7725 family protein [Clostridium sp. YIM B02551]|uniref:sce7725 family protein n=1 Tax=Clostridium sp. YIM B02551 TaxID=2910679 RepID=UPI001EEB4B8C|nr:sce7725 family protein [Clostridium sp. YIM B02551]